MRSPTLPFLVLALLGLFSLGASCNGAPEATPGQTTGAAKIEKLDRVETSSLTDGERRRRCIRGGRVARLTPARTEAGRKVYSQVDL